MHECFGHRCFIHQRPCIDAFAANEMNGVLIPSHNAAVGADIIGNNPVALLFQTFGLCIGNDIFSLGGKADNQWRAIGFRLCDGCKNVRIFRELQMRRSGLFFFDFLVACRLHTPVGNSSTKNSNIGGQSLRDREA